MFNEEFAEVFKFWNELSRYQKENLLKDFNKLKEKDWLYLKNLAQNKTQTLPRKDIFSAPQHVDLKWPTTNKKDWDLAVTLGERLIKEGKIGILTVAGGQGTRLGFNGPKGILPITPIKQKSLFQLFAEKIQKTEKDFNVKLHWFIMTSEENHDATISHFEQKNIFPLNRLHFFKQGSFPAFDLEGKVILSEKHKISFAPNGHGGIFDAMFTSGTFEKLQALGVKTLSYFQVDNPLVKPLDSGFLGLHSLKKSEMSTKVIKKLDPSEKVGVFVQQNQRLALVEYSNLSEDLLHKKSESGELYFNLGNTAMHAIEVDFLEKIVMQKPLPIHRSIKKIPFLDDSGKLTTPTEPNAIKFEKFIFDALPLAANPLLLEVDRKKEFSPVKNLNGKDSVETALRAQIEMFAEWLKSAGVEIPVDSNNNCTINLEVSPSFAGDKAKFVNNWNTQNRRLTKLNTDCYIS